MKGRRPWSQPTAMAQGNRARPPVLRSSVSQISATASWESTANNIGVLLTDGTCEESDVPPAMPGRRANQETRCGPAGSVDGSRPIGTLMR